jgi:hypothetical protein
MVTALYENITTSIIINDRTSIIKLVSKVNMNINKRLEIKITSIINSSENKIETAFFIFCLFSEKYFIVVQFIIKIKSIISFIPKLLIIFIIIANILAKLIFEINSLPNKENVFISDAINDDEFVVM